MAFENNNLVCPNCGNNDKEAITITDIKEEDLRVYTCDFCFTNVKKTPLSLILKNLGKGGIKK